MSTIRPHAVAYCGGAYGDEGKGRIVDEVVASFVRTHKVIVYRDNGGANAGHTVEFKNGNRIALHQLPSGVFHEGVHVVLGKGMVIHPQDLLSEIEQVEQATGGIIPATILIDEQAVLSLDTHRAMEGMLKNWEEGGKGSTGRGIAPAYVDVLYRHPLRVKDLVPFNREKIEKHYRLYEAFVKGLGGELASTIVPLLTKNTQQEVGGLSIFVDRLEEQAQKLAPFVKGLNHFLDSHWQDLTTAWVFEKAQAIGLDNRWGVYPDVTASDCTFDGIYSATEGVIDPMAIGMRAAVLKGTYMSSVGTRQLPTVMESELADKIREDAHEYGATTRRPRGIAHLDIPALRFFSRVGRCTHLVLTHMDIVYPSMPISVCVNYTLNGKTAPYRPDQQYLSSIQPEYVKMETWDSEEIASVTKASKLPQTTKAFISFLETQIGLPVDLITTGPKRDQSLSLRKSKAMR